jgi:hypothetical protein
MTQKSLRKIRTSDLYYAAYLKVAGVTFLETEREGGRVYFVFEHSPNIDDLKSQYYSSKSRIPALPFAQELQTMKLLTHDTMRG